MHATAFKPTTCLSWNPLAQLENLMLSHFNVGHYLLLCVVLLQEAKKLFEEKFKSGKNRWFFTKLRF